MENTENHKDQASPPANGKKQRPHNGRNSMITLLLIAIIFPLSALDYQQWDNIEQEYNEWHWLRNNQNKDAIKRYIDNAYNKRFKKEASILYDKLVKQEQAENLARIRSEMENRIRYQEVLNPVNKRDAIKIQKLLMLHGYYKGKLDGQPGKSTSNAIREFRKDHNLPASDAWDKQLQSVINLLAINQGHEVILQLLNEHNSDTMKHYEIIANLKNNPVKTIEKMTADNNRKFGYPGTTVLDLLKADDSSFSSYIVFRASGVLIAYDSYWKTKNIPDYLLEKIHKVESVRTRNKKLGVRQVIIVFGSRDLKNSFTQSSLYKVVNTLCYYYNQRYLKRSGRSYMAIIPRSLPVSVFTSRYRNKFAMNQYIQSIINPDKITIETPYPVISKHNGWVKLSTIRATAHDKKAGKNEPILFSVDVVNIQQKPIATYPNLTYVRAGPVEKGQFFALGKYNDERGTPKTPVLNRKPNQLIDLDKILSGRYTKQKVVYNKTLLKNGKRLYTLHCAACHRSNGKGLDPTFPDITRSKVVQSDPDHIAEMLIDTNRRKGMMPVFRNLESGELHALSVYVYQTFRNQ